MCFSVKNCFIPAVCYAILPNYVSVAEIKTNANRSSAFVSRQWDSMPIIFKVSFVVLISAFYIFTFIKKFSVFHQLDAHDRLEVLNQWKYSNFSLFRDFVRFFETFVIYDVASNNP
jgi:hypothetical protein